MAVVTFISKAYLDSFWCGFETGVAASFRCGMEPACHVEPIIIPVQWHKQYDLWWRKRYSNRTAVLTCLQCGQRIHVESEAKLICGSCFYRDKTVSDMTVVDSPRRDADEEDSTTPRAWVADLMECADRLDRLASIRKTLWNCRRKHKVR
jgi:hypothetical protein